MDDLRLVHAHGPLFVWVRPRAPRLRAIVAQVGVYGVAPTFDPETEPAASRRCASLVVQAFAAAETIRFVPAIQDDRYVIYSSGKCAYGSIIFYHADGTVRFLKDILCEAGFAFRVDQFYLKFNDYSAVGKPNKYAAEYILKVLVRFIENDIRLDSRAYSLIFAEARGPNFCTDVKPFDKELRMSMMKYVKTDSDAENANHYQQRNRGEIDPGEGCSRNWNIRDEIAATSTSGNPLSFTSVVGRATIDYIDKLSASRLLVHAKYGNVTIRWESMRCVDMSRRVLLNLARVVEEPTAVQSAVWPAIMRGHSAYVVGASGTGKTLAILAPLCTLLIDFNRRHLPATGGPLALILCPTNKVSATTCDILNSLLLNTGSDLNVLMLDDSLDDYQKFSTLRDGCDVLITTPSISRLAEADRPYLDLGRLYYCVLIDADIINMYHYNDIAKLLEECEETFQGDRDLEFKIFAESRTWCKIMERIAKLDTNPMICISAMQETLVYARSHVQTNFTMKNDKIDMLVSELLDGEAMHGCVIVCANDREATYVAKMLKSVGFSIMTIGGGMTMDDIIQVGREWKIYRGMLVCTDFALSLIDVTNATTIINYSLPTSLSAFNQRFVCSVDSIANLWRPSDAPRVLVKVYLDETNEFQIPALLKLIERCDYYAEPGVATKFYKRTSAHMRSICYTKVPICSGLMNFGFCSGECEQRHELDTEHDAIKMNLRLGEYVNFQITHVYNALHYSVKVTEHMSPGNACSEVKNNYFSLSLNLLAYYLRCEKRRSVLYPRNGDLYCVEVKNNYYYRCQLVEKANKNEGLRKWIVRLLDLGDLPYMCDQDNLLLLPSELRLENVFDVRLAGIIPTQGTNNDFNRDLFKYRVMMDTGHSFMRGRVVLGFGNCLWLEGVEFCNCLQSLEVNVERPSITQFILNNNMGMASRFQVECLRELYRRDMYKLSDFVFNIATEETYVLKPRWARLEYDRSNEVYIMAVLSPDVFYVRSCATVGVVNLISDDLRAAFLLRNRARPAEGEYCIARFFDNTYRRARVDAIERTGVECFFVDFGTRAIIAAQHVRPIPYQYVTKFPFQAIECRMMAVRPANAADWDDDAVTYLRNMSFDSLHSKKKFIAWPGADCEVAMHTRGKKHVVALFDSYTLINDAIVREGFAEHVNVDRIDLDHCRAEMIKIANADRQFKMIDDFIRGRALTFRAKTNNFFMPDFLYDDGATARYKSRDHPGTSYSAANNHHVYSRIHNSDGESEESDDE